MPRVRSSIEILAPLSLVFDISNDLERWPEVMPEYSSVEVVDREGRKVWFCLTHTTGTSWVSWRYVCREEAISVAERHEPRAPFKYMQIVWSYEALGRSKTVMTWDMCFELPEKDESQTPDWEKRLREHTLENQARMKRFIEAEYSHRAIPR